MKINFRNIFVFSSIAYLFGYAMGHVMKALDTPLISIVIVIVLQAFIVTKFFIPKLPFTTELDK